MDIKRTNNFDIDKLFRFNDNKFYTHFDIQCARKLGLECILNREGTYNCLLYQKGRSKGNVMFEPLVNYLFKLKKDGVPYAKEIINDLWGLMCTRNTTKRYVYGDSPDVDINQWNCGKLIDIRPMSNNVDIGDDHIIHFIKENRKYYKYDYARIGVFLTSYVRWKMAEAIYPIRENVYRCHTDGFISSIPASHLKEGTNIGDWKKTLCHVECTITNAMTVIPPIKEWKKLK